MTGERNSASEGGCLLLGGVLSERNVGKDINFRSLVRDGEFLFMTIFMPRRLNKLEPT